MKNKISNLGGSGEKMKWGQKRVSRSPRRFYGGGDAVFRGIQISDEDKEIYSLKDVAESSGCHDADDDIASGRTKKFTSVDEMLDALKSPW